MSLLQERLGDIILQAMSQQSRIDLITSFVHNDEALKNSILGNHQVESKVTDLKLNGSGSSGQSRATVGKNLVTTTDENGQYNNMIDNSKCLKGISLPTENDYLENEYLSDADQDLDKLNDTSNNVTDTEDKQCDTSNNVTDVSFDTEADVFKYPIAVESKDTISPETNTDTEVFEDEDEEWEYEWEEGEDNGYEYLEQDEDDYKVESFAGSFSISVLSK